MGRSKLSLVSSAIYSSGKSIASLARAIGISNADLQNYLHDRMDKISKRSRRLIRAGLIERGFLPAPKIRPRCTCPNCGRTHAQGRVVPQAVETDKIRSTDCKASSPTTSSSQKINSKGV